MEDKGPDIVVNRERPTAYDLAQKMWDAFILKLDHGSLYKFTGKYFQYLSPDAAYQQIFETCKKEVAQVGTGLIVKRAYSTILMNGNLNSNQEKPETAYTAFENGILRLSDGVLLPHTPDIFLTSLVKARYNPSKIYCPKFDVFLRNFTCQDDILAERILQMIGYCLVTDASGKVLFVLQGPSGTAKSTLLDLFRLLFDLEGITSLDFVELAKDPHALSDMIGKSICFFPDLTDKPLDPVAVGIIKRLTGGDLMTANPKHHPRIKFYNTAKLLAAVNGKLLIQSPDDAFQRRVVAIPCNYYVPDEIKQRDYAKQFADELDGIVTKAVQAYFRLKDNHYQFAGNYQVNDGMVSNPDGPSSVGSSVEELVKEFLLDTYEACADGFVQTTDAYTEFSKGHLNVSRAEFSPSFYNSAEELFGCDQSRKRKPGQKNALPCVIGLAHR